MAVNDFQVFAGAGGANVMTQANYLALAAKASGFQSGLATSPQLNKVWRQASIMSAMVGQFICDNAPGQPNAVDDGTTATLEANFLAAVQAVNQQKLTADLNLYVNPSTGNDANAGTGPTVAFRTIQKAFDIGYSNYNYNRHQLIVNLAAGTYTAGLALSGLPVGCPQVQLVGNAGSPSTVQINVTNSNAILINLGCNCSISGVTITATGTSTNIIGLGYGLTCSQGWITISNCIFGSCGTIQVAAQNSGVILMTTCTFQGTSLLGLSAQTGGYLYVSNTTLTFNSALYTGAGNGTANASTGAIIGAVGTLFAGSATGTRFNVGTCGVIITNGGGANFWPGSVAGNTNASTFGVYT